MINTVSFYSFYKRYLWAPEDFERQQESNYGYPNTVFGSILKGVLEGLNYDGAAGLDVSLLNGVAVNEDGKLLVIDNDNNVAVTVTNNVRSLVVLRPLEEDGTTITRPTAPFDPVVLFTTQTAQIVAIAGDVSNFPSPVAGDVVLFGVVASGGVITSVNHTLCDLVGKSSELRNYRPQVLVGNQRQCDYSSLDEAVAEAVSGSVIRVLENVSIGTTIDVNVPDVELVFAPGVEITKDGAATGLLLSENGIKVRGGRFADFDTSNDVAIGITSDYCGVFESRFSNNDTDVADINETSTTVGVINE